MSFLNIGSGTRVLVPAHIVTLEIFENTKTVFAKGTTEITGGKKLVRVEKLSVKEPYSIKIKTTNGTEYINCNTRDEAIKTYAEILKMINPKVNTDKIIMEVSKLYVKKETRFK